MLLIENDIFIMKTKFLYLTLLLTSALFMTSCGGDDDDVDISNLPEAVTDAFHNKYPGIATNSVSWESKGKYYVAKWDEANGMRDIEAWFVNTPDASQSWAMTETDYGKNLFLVPAEINAELEKTEYRTAVIDDISLYEYPVQSRNVYIIEVEPIGQTQDMMLLFDATTYKFLKAIPDNDTEITPDTVF